MSKCYKKRIEASEKAEAKSKHIDPDDIKKVYDKHISDLGVRPSKFF